MGILVFLMMWWMFGFKYAILLGLIIAWIKED